jgi:CRISPR-associated protein Cas2
MKNIKEIPEYQLMWMMVMFDLPTDTAAERKIASKFRHHLMDNGFEMAQFSVYMRFTGTKEQSQKYIKTVGAKTPEEGDVCILFFTDKQFSQIIHVSNLKVDSLAEKPEQLILF